MQCLSWWKHVYKRLQESSEHTKGTYHWKNSETWIKGLKYARRATQELQDHYDEMPEGARSKHVDKADLRIFFYKNETTFTLEKYVTKLKGILNVLENYKVTIYKEQNVDYLLDQITSPI